MKSRISIFHSRLHLLLPAGFRQPGSIPRLTEYFGTGERPNQYCGQNPVVPVFALAGVLPFQQRFTPRLDHGQGNNGYNGRTKK
ncbi:MAG TPA: hypothetical protein VM011_06375 [Gammaproteobacteria bacterium]|nr:hypothetical protein [Gammaproteobacteria bacterium]